MESHSDPSFDTLFSTQNTSSPSDKKELPYVRLFDELEQLLTPPAPNTEETSRTNQVPVAPPLPLDEQFPHVHLTLTRAPSEGLDESDLFYRAYTHLETHDLGQRFPASLGMSLNASYALLMESAEWSLFHHTTNSFLHKKQRTDTHIPLLIGNGFLLYDRATHQCTVQHEDGTLGHFSFPVPIRELCAFDTNTLVALSDEANALLICDLSAPFPSTPKYIPLPPDCQHNKDKAHIELAGNHVILSFMRSPHAFLLDLSTESLSAFPAYHSTDYGYTSSPGSSTFFALRTNFSGPQHYFSLCAEDPSRYTWKEVVKSTFPIRSVHALGTQHAVLHLEKEHGRVVILNTETHGPLLTLAHTSGTISSVQIDLDENIWILFDDGRLSKWGIAPTPSQD